jgi:hypothetical protein
MIQVSVDMINIPDDMIYVPQDMINVDIWLMGISPCPEIRYHVMGKIYYFLGSFTIPYYLTNTTYMDLYSHMTG